MINFFMITLVALIFMTIGLLIWKKQKVNLIHAYHVKGVEDIKGYCSAMGKAIFILGIFLLLNGVMDVLFLIHKSIRVGILIFGMIIIFGSIFKIQKKYSGRYI
ncbi:uncharacterized protein DUF3784 [Natranaerovirga hydrolytica]|uniref:Uncharacterized protein DUF3784 n=1 Tax=Natranaerovirga hydrolytica TaxID=680378 RepID=A0A4R1MXP6_9FIRM|nr:DUF3784 domain-containing protein [Natranaerovirga hydrolytica]TCK98048.1 uncharacterized protein DUF3784 [Natranaerovirga hydrolytica]